MATEDQSTEVKESLDLNGNEPELTDAERETLAAAKAESEGQKPATDGTDAGEGGQKPAAAAADGKPAGEKPAEAKGSGAAGEAGKEGAAAADDSAATPPPSAAPPAPPPPAPFAPSIKLTGEARDFDAELKKLDEDRAQLRKKLDAGDIDDDEFEDQRELIADKKAEIIADRRTAQALAQAEQSAQQGSWDYLVQNFLSLPDNATIGNNPILLRAWEAGMQEAVTAAAREGRQLSDWETMLAGREQLVAAGVLAAAPAAAATATAQKPAAPSPPPDRAPATNEVPKGLGAAPNGADVTERTSAENYADISNIEDLEDRWARMSEADRERVLSGLPGKFED